MSYSTPTRMESKMTEADQWTPGCLAERWPSSHLHVVGVVYTLLEPRPPSLCSQTPDLGPFLEPPPSPATTLFLFFSSEPSFWKELFPFSVWMLTLIQLQSDHISNSHQSRPIDSLDGHLSLFTCPLYSTDTCAVPSLLGFSSSWFPGHCSL